MSRIQRRLRRENGVLCQIVDWYSNGRDYFYSATVLTNCGDVVIVEHIRPTLSEETPTCLTCSVATTTSWPDKYAAYVATTNPQAP